MPVPPALRCTVWFYNPDKERVTGANVVNKLVAGLSPPFCHVELQLPDGEACSIVMHGTVRMRQRTFDTDYYTGVVLRAPPRRSVIGAKATGGETIWDGRFLVRLASADVAPLEVLPAGIASPGAGRMVEDGILRRVAAALPVTRGLDGEARLSHVLCGRRSVALVSVAELSVIFRPPRPFAGAAFAGSPAQV